MNRALAEGERAECWVFADDYRALGGMKALQEHGRLGRNIRLYGLNNTRAGRFSLFPLNTSDAMLDEQVSWLLRHLRNTAPESKILTPEILIRSCKEKKYEKKSKNTNQDEVKNEAIR